METLREQYETGQEGWRAAIAERSRRELTEREAAIREKLARERDEEIEVHGDGRGGERSPTHTDLFKHYLRWGLSLIKLTIDPIHPITILSDGSPPP